MEAASGNYTEVSSILSKHLLEMSTGETTFELPPSRPKRADALRNHERLIAAAREAFAERGCHDLAGGDRTTPRGRDRHALPATSPRGRICSRPSISTSSTELCRSAEDHAELPPSGKPSTAGCTASSATSRPSARSLDAVLVHGPRRGVLHELPRRDLPGRRAALRPRPAGRRRAHRRLVRRCAADRHGHREGLERRGRAHRAHPRPRT